MKFFFKNLEDFKFLLCFFDIGDLVVIFLFVVYEIVFGRDVLNLFIYLFFFCEKIFLF